LRKTLLDLPAKESGVKEVPVLRVEELTEVEK
jgi:hypothetical protein